MIQSQCRRRGGSMQSLTRRRLDATMPVRDANVQRDDATRRCRLNATMPDATMPDATVPNATMPRCQYAMPMFNDVNVQRDDTTRRCRLNATMQSQGRYETRQSLTRRRLDATMPNATVTNATMPRCQYATSMFSVTMPRCNDARRDGATMPRDDADSMPRCRV